MSRESVVSSRPDREITKKVIKPGDCMLVPYEDARCKIALTNVQCKDESGDCSIDPESRIFGNCFDGNVLIGDQDCFIDRDFELILQQMCNGEVCEAKIIYKDGEGRLVKEISFTVELQDTTEEQLVSDWGWVRLYEASQHHKESGVELVKQKRITDAFRRFNKSLKMLVAIEPIDPAQVPEETVQEMIDLKVPTYYSNILNEIVTMTALLFSICILIIYIIIWKWAECGLNRI